MNEEQLDEALENSEVLNEIAESEIDDIDSEDTEEQSDDSDEISFADLGLSHAISYSTSRNSAPFERGRKPHRARSHRHGKNSRVRSSSRAKNTHSKRPCSRNRP